MRCTFVVPNELSNIAGVSVVEVEVNIRAVSFIAFGENDENRTGIS